MGQSLAGESEGKRLAQQWRDAVEKRQALQAALAKLPPYGKEARAHREALVIIKQRQNDAAGRIGDFLARHGAEALSSLSMRLAEALEQGPLSDDERHDFAGAIRAIIPRYAFDNWIESGRKKRREGRSAFVSRVLGKSFGEDE